MIHHLIHRASCLLVVFSVFSCVGAVKREGSPEAAETIRSWGLGAEFLASYRTSDQAETRNEEILVQNLDLKTESGRIAHLERLTGAGPIQGDHFIKDKFFQFESIYDPHRDPYFAVLTKSTVCPERFRPARATEQHDGVPVSLLTLYANDRLTYGSCTDEQAVYRAVIGMMRCPRSGALFMLESFVPKKAFTDADMRDVASMHCL